MQVVEEILRSIRADLENLEKSPRSGERLAGNSQSSLSRASSPPRNIIERGLIP